MARTRSRFAVRAPTTRHGRPAASPRVAAGNEPRQRRLAAISECLATPDSLTRTGLITQGRRARRRPDKPTSDRSSARFSCAARDVTMCRHMVDRPSCSSSPRSSPVRVLAAASAAQTSHEDWPVTETKPYLNTSDADASFTGTDQNDKLLGGHGNDKLFGLDGDDVIWGDYKPSGQTASQRDRVRAGTGDDWVYASHGRNVIYGGPGNDTIRNWFGRGFVDCGGGNDILYVSRKSDPKVKRKNCETISHKSAREVAEEDSATRAAPSAARGESVESGAPQVDPVDRRRRRPHARQGLVAPVRRGLAQLARALGQQEGQLAGRAERVGDRMAVVEVLGGPQRPADLRHDHDAVRRVAGVHRRQLGQRVGLVGPRVADGQAGR